MDYSDFLTLAVILGSILTFGVGAVLALSWAVRDGQFENFHRGARSIFDADEPIGQMTDSFPGGPTVPTRLDADDLQDQAEREAELRREIAKN